MVGHHSGLNQIHPDISYCLNLSTNASMGRQISVDSCLQFCRKCIDGSVLAFQKCMDGSVLTFLKCMDSSILAFQKCMDSSVLSYLTLPTRSAPTSLPQSGNSKVPWLLCKKSNKIIYLKQNDRPQGILARHICSRVFRKFIKELDLGADITRDSSLIIYFELSIF